ncbi:MFS transporter [Mycobacterium sp. RTGN5]|uniref:MFS transporter n=1 Tax=Mycobacterium sp. RTGN5 TaxID=3016522 RepID=UPI0029C92D78|nr:MFS transporter [Mycobacterium sp. RTGN5]
MRAQASTAAVTRLVVALSFGVIGVTVVQTLMFPLLPVLPALLKTSASDASWAITATLLTAAVAMPVFGRLGDLYGPKLMLLVCATLLIVGSVVAALANSLILLVLGRGLQGCSVAILPLGISVIRAAVPPRSVGLAIGVFSASVGIGGALNLPLSAVIVDNLDWHALFWFSGALGVVALLGFALFVPRVPASAHNKFDPLGAVLLSAGLVALLLPVSKGASWGWTSGTALGSFGASAAIFAVFAWWQLQTSSPLVDLRMSIRRPVLITNVATIALGFAIVSMLVTLPQLLELPRQTGYGLGQSLLNTALVMAVNGVTIMAASPMAAVIAARLSARAALGIGAAIMAVSYLLAAWLLHTVLQVLLCTAVAGIGVGLSFAASAMLITAAVPASETAAANGINQLVRMCGQAAGSAVAGAVLAAMTMPFAGAELPSLAGIRTAMLLAAAGSGLAAACAMLIPHGRLQSHTATGKIIT